MRHPLNKGDRQAVRLTKGMRRIHEDRAEHGSDHSCDCFSANGRGKVFARFADYPASCSCMLCSNGTSRRFGFLTVQERRMTEDIA
jgi:hypothetical protein